jgi:glycosyltransferase involved in cell wall biosynthesis
MNFLINASNLKAGGGLQVADSICGQLNRFQRHHFVVVLSLYLTTTKDRLQGYENVDVLDYTIPNTFKTIVLGRDSFLDELVESKHIDAVLTVFGPSRWRPSVPHLSGFALPQLVIPESPYFTRMGFLERLKWKLWCSIRKWSLKRSADCFWTENPYISKRLNNKIHNVKVYTVSNYYNQVFDTPESWKKGITLPNYDGITCLSISSPTPHKNFGIIEGIVRYLREAHPGFKVRFVLTCDEEQWPMAGDVLEHVEYVGKTEVSEGPYLYEQAGIMFMPTLLECFTATYPEAMKMGVPIVTTDLEFARGLCGDAACCYSAVDAKAAAEAIYKVATDKTYAKQLVENGKKQLLTYDNYEQRADKLIGILEEIVK